MKKVLSIMLWILNLCVGNSWIWCGDEMDRGRWERRRFIKARSDGAYLKKRQKREEIVDFVLG